MKRFRVVVMLAAALVCVAALEAQSKRAMTFDDLAAMHRVGEITVSPDGRWVAYSVGTPDMTANRVPRNIWLAPLGAGEARQLTRSGRDSRPRWSPDGKRIAFISSRDGAPQVYIISIEGGEATKLTSISTGAANLLWSPDGKTLAFTSDVYPDCRDDACNAKRDADAESNKVKARVYDRLLYRHWTDWEDGKRSHLFVVGVEGGTPRDLTPGADYDVPPFSLGGPEPIAFSPNGRELCFTANMDKDEALSTNADLFIVPVGGGQIRRITTNPGYDGGPAYSPDGKSIAYHAQLTAGYESDRWRAMLYDRASGRSTNLTETFDRSVDAIAWSPDNRTLYFDAEDRGNVPLYSMAAAPGSTPKQIVTGGAHGEFALTPDGRTIVFTRARLNAPTEIFAASVDGTGERQITRHNVERLAQLDLPEVEHFWFAGAAGTQVHGMIVRPPNFDARKKYPIIMLCHGGPQTMWTDAWSYRWNAQLFAAPGYVVVMVNRRGSTGFGQKFTDEINSDWGGKAFQDIMLGLDHVLAKYPFMDGNRVAAAGASYGGFMMDWMASQSKGRFKALVTHAGVYNFESMYGATEELWFVEWDLRGTPWTNPKTYSAQSPNKFAADFGKYKTPTLVIHGELDFRVPYTQGLEMFTALQRQGVPSRLVMFPDEGHWILKPQNSRFWFGEVHAWLAKYLK